VHSSNTERSAISVVERASQFSRLNEVIAKSCGGPEERRKQDG